MAASALYACTKCTQRYPFEELSQGQQLCKVGGRRALCAALPAGSRASGGRVPGSTASRLLAGWGRLGRSWRSRVGLSQAATSPPCRRDPVQTFLTPALAGAALSFHWEAGRRVCTFSLGTRTRSCRADGILLPCPGK